MRLNEYARCYYGHVFKREDAGPDGICPASIGKLHASPCGNMQVTPVPDAVINAIKRKYRDDLAAQIKVLKELMFDNLNGCYFFVMDGMYHGVEPDGYIHT